LDGVLVGHDVDLETTVSPFLAVWSCPPHA
jgi:hypothetical protein